MTPQNPVEEIWRIRDELGAEQGYDVDKLFERLRREEKKYGDHVVHHVENRWFHGTARHPVPVRDGGSQRKEDDGHDHGWFDPFPPQIFGGPLAPFWNAHGSETTLAGKGSHALF